MLWKGSFVKKIRDKFGGRRDRAHTASALMNIDISDFFSDIGIPVFDCYGLSETSPAVTMNCFSANKRGSEGRPIEGVTLENGMLTQTMKLKRRKVFEKYGAEIDALYQ